MTPPSQANGSALSFEILTAGSWGENRVDPYLVWTADINFENLKGRGNLPPSLTFVAELKNPYNPEGGDANNFNFKTKVHEIAQAQPSLEGTGFIKGVAKLIKSLIPLGRPRGLPSENPATVPFLYETRLPATRLRPSFITFRIDLNSGLDGQEGWNLIKRWINLLVVHPEIKRLQLGFNRNPTVPISLKPSPTGLPVEAEKPTPPADAPKVVIGIVDDAGLFAHGAFRTIHKQGIGMRVWRYWNQSYYKGEETMAPEAPWRIRRKPGSTQKTDALYGRELTDATMNALIGKFTDGDFVDEDSLYRSLALTERIQLRESHAALVAPLACGKGSAIPQKDGPHGSAKFLPSDDPASQAPLVFVQLPREVVHVTNGRAVAVNALDAIHYVMHMAGELVGVGNALPPVVVNLSLGAVAGPHDGTSIFEQAMDELVKGYNDKLAIVLAAGNSHGTKRQVDKDLQYLPSGVHAKAEVKSNSSVHFALYVPPDKQFETYMELWIDAAMDLSGVCVTVLPPIGNEHKVHLNERAIWPFTKNGLNRPMAAVYFIKKPVQSTKKRSMVLLVLAATQPAWKKVHAPSGQWKVTVEGPSLEPSNTASEWRTPVEVWVERDDRLTGIRRPQSARLVEAEGCISPSDDNTVTSLGSGTETFNVGALNAHGDASGGKWRVSAYSAEATDENLMDFSAVADAGMAMSGIRVAGNRSGMVLRANGTSVAAPQATRCIAHALADGHSLQAIRRLLAQDTSRTPRRGKVIP